MDEEKYRKFLRQSAKCYLCGAIFSAPVPVLWLTGTLTWKDQAVMAPVVVTLVMVINLGSWWAARTSEKSLDVAMRRIRQKGSQYENRG